MKKRHLTQIQRFLAVDHSRVKMYSRFLVCVICCGSCCWGARRTTRDLHDVGHVSLIGSVLVRRSCTAASDNGSLYRDVDDLVVFCWTCGKFGLAS